MSTQTSSPYSGTAIATYKTANIDTQKKWASITASAMVGLVALSLSAVASLVVGTTVGNVLGSALDSVLTKARAAGYSGNAYLSYKVYRYDSTNSTNTNRYSKMYGYYYGKANYTGVKSTHTFYVHNYFA